MTVSITGRIAQYGARMIEAVNNNMFEQFISNFKNMMEHENKFESTEGRPREAEPLKVASLFGAVIFSELKKKFDNKQNQNERLLNSLKYN